MKPRHPVELLACAIACQEGWFVPGTVPVTHNNPGDLKYAGQRGATGNTGAIASFASVPLGITALFRQIWLQASMGQTVRQIIEAWAPVTENDTEKYVENVLAWTGLPGDVVVLELLPPLVDLRTFVNTDPDAGRMEYETGVK